MMDGGVVPRSGTATSTPCTTIVTKLQQTEDEEVMGTGEAAEHGVWGVDLLVLS